MSYIVTIAGKPVTLAWTQESAKAFRVRASKIGVDPGTLWRGISKPRSAEYSVSAFVWLLVPRDIYQAYPTPEDLAADLEEKDAQATITALVGIVADMAPDAEKKTSSPPSPSPGSNSG